MSMELTVTGIPEVNALMERVGEMAGNQIAENALIAGALLIENEAKRLAPFRTGTLRRSIHVGESSPTQVKVGTNVIYARAQEYGATIVPKNGEFLHFKTDRGWVKTRGPIQIPPRPFMRPAFESQRDAVMREIADAFRSALARAAG